MAHCISPSSCDNTTSLNDINLQLHASSTVSNPYTFSISSNKSFSANIGASVPTTPTSLIWTQVYGKIWKCTIPKNVKRLKIYFFEEDENSNYVIVGVTPGKTYDNMLLEKIICNEGEGWEAVIKNLSSEITWGIYIRLEKQMWILLAVYCIQIIFIVFILLKSTVILQM